MKISIQELLINENLLSGNEKTKQPSIKLKYVLIESELANAKE